jgi:hypothetical protein
MLFKRILTSRNLAPCAVDPKLPRPQFQFVVDLFVNNDQPGSVLVAYNRFWLVD